MAESKLVQLNFENNIAIASVYIVYVFSMLSLDRIIL